MPNTTSASMATMVMIGRLMAKSEMNMPDTRPNLQFDATSLIASPHRRARASSPAPRRRSSMSPSFRPDAISTRSVCSIAQAERDVDALGLAVLTRSTHGFAPFSLTAFCGTTRPVADWLTTRPSANSPATSRPPTLGIDT